MLKLDKISDLKEFLFKLDMYIPFSIEFSSNNRQPVYFMFGNDTTTMLKISIDKNTYEILNITLTIIDKDCIYICNENKYNIIGEIHFRSPIFKVDRTLNTNDELYFYNNNMNIELFIGINYLNLSPTRNKSIKYVENKNIIFGFDAYGNINNILVKNIPHDDVIFIKNIYMISSKAKHMGLAYDKKFISA